jgi:hypothetical protein
MAKKKIDLAILDKIYKLSLILKTSTSINEFIHLIYATNPEGQKRNVSLTEKLNIFNCISLTDYSKFEVIENKELPSKLFIIGLFLGDGSLGFVFDSPPSRAPKFYVKIVFNFASQSYNSFNVQLLNLIAKRMNLKPQIYIRQSGMIGLEYNGETVFKYILPFLAEHQD